MTKVLQTSAPSAQARFLWLLGAGGITAVLLLALWLRWQYATQVQLHVDEFTTLWAASQVQANGAPIMPSGVVYTRGILSSYLVALAQQIAGDAPLVGRSVSIMFGVAAVLVVFLAGRREWTARVGFVAAVGLTLVPEIIVWSGRARFYSPLVFFALLTMWAAFTMIRLPPSAQADTWRVRWRTPLLFASMFVLALFSQEQTAFLYPSILLAIIAWRGWRFLLQPPVAFAQLICIGALVVRFLIEQIGQPGYFAAVQEEKAYIRLFDNIAGTWQVYSHLLLSARRLPWSVLTIVALVVALYSLWSTARNTKQLSHLLDRLPGFHQATLFFGWQFVFVLLVILTMVGGAWRDSRYLLLIEPCWMLLGAAGLVWLVDLVIKPPVWRWIVTLAVAVTLGWWMWPITANALTQEAEGYQSAMEYVATHLLPGDVVMSPQPPACAWGIGRPCDYYVTQRSWEAYVIPRGDKLIDRWSGAELLNTTAQLEHVLQTAPRVWLISDSERLGRRYNDDFLRVIVQQFRKVYDSQGVAVLLLEEWETLPPVVAAHRYDPPPILGSLALVGWERSEITEEGRVPVTFFWEKVGEIYDQINTSMQIVAADGAAITQDDGPMGRGMTATFDFANVVLPDPKEPILPTNLLPGRYRIDMVAYNTRDNELLSEPVAIDWISIGPSPEPPAVVLDEAWREGMQLVGRDDLPAELRAGEEMVLRLVWRATRPLADDFTMFVHLLDEEGNIVAQHDRAPEGGFYPTSGWDAGELVADLYQLKLPDVMPQGRLRLVVGLYNSVTGQRLLLENGEDMLEVAAW